MFKPLTPNHILLDQLSYRLSYQYHACIPLGWAPVPMHGTYYPGYTATMGGNKEFLDAVWRGKIRKDELRRPDVSAVFDVLNHLVTARLVTRSPGTAGFEYFLSPAAMPYFYGSSNYENNRGSMPYLCYSTIVPERILWSQAIDPEPNRHVGRGELYRISFTWRPSTPARWADDDVLRTHSVILAPVHNVLTAKVLFRDKQWYLLNLYDRSRMLPQAANPAAWRAGSR